MTLICRLKNIKSMVLYIGLLVFSLSVTAQDIDQCHETQSYTSWDEAHRICTALISQQQQNPTQQSPMILGELLLNSSKVAFQFKRYEVAEALLNQINSDHADYITDEKNRYHWFYLMGKIKLRTADFEQAVSNFQQSLNVAKQSELPARDEYMSYALNALGLSLKRMNKYHQALLAYRQSLTFKRALGEPLAVAKTLTNIATVYGLLEDHESALQYYLEAQDHFLQADLKTAVDWTSVSHNYENIGVTYNHLGEYRLSIEALNEAFNVHPTPEKNDSLVRIYTHMAHSYLQIDMKDLAEEFYLKALAKNQQSAQNDPQLLLHLSQYFFNNGQMEEALNFIDDGLTSIDNNERNKNTLSMLYLLKSQILQQRHDFDAAINSLIEHNLLREEVLENKFNQDIKNVTYQIEIEKNQSDLALLAKENQLSEVKINRQYWVIFSMFLVVFIIGFYVRMMFRKKSQEKQKLMAAIHSHKHKLDKMENSKDQLKEIFSDTTDAVMCVDSGWVVAFYNSKFDELFKKHHEISHGKKMADVFPELHQAVSHLPMDGNDMPENTTIPQFVIQTVSGMSKVDIRVNTINLLDDFMVLSVGDKNHALIKDLNQKDHAIKHIIDNISDNDELNQATLEVLKTELQKNIYTEILQKKSDTDFRSYLVELMRECVEIWGAHTKTNRIELADVSGYWKVTIDDGRLRTRAMDRYLQIKHLPKNPRWRQVVKTAHYILSECDLSTTHRQRLNGALETFLAIINDR